MNVRTTMRMKRTLKILILEDNPERIKKFRRMFLPADELFIHTDVESAISQLKSESDFNLLLLDHDLGGEIFVDSSLENTGSGFCRRFCAMENYSRNLDIIVHSMNPAGARNMVSILHGAGFGRVKTIPFSSL